MALTADEVTFLRSLRRAVSRTGGSEVRLLDPNLQPLANPSAPAAGASLIQEPRRGYWSGSPDFSRTKTGKYPVSASIETVLNVDNLPGPPRGRGIVLQRSESLIVDPPTTQLCYAVWARITFGIGGQLNTVLVDWANTVVNIPGSSIRVDAIFKSLQPEGVTLFPYNVGNPVEVEGTLGVQVAVDPLVSKGYNTLTQYITSSVTSIDIPPYAVGFWFNPPPPVTPTATGYWFCLNGTSGTAAFTNSGFYSDAQIVANGQTALNVLPIGSRTLDFSNSDLTVEGTPLVWAIGV